MQRRELKELIENGFVGPDGSMTGNPSRYAKGATAVVFEMIGGVAAMADWADNNQTEFYTKMFTKLIGREVDIGVSENVEELLASLDDTVDSKAAVVEADFVDVTPGIADAMPEDFDTPARSASLTPERLYRIALDYIDE